MKRKKINEEIIVNLIKSIEELSRKNELLLNLIALKIIEGKDYRDQVKILAKAGLKLKDIAYLTGRSINNIRVTLHLIRKKQGGS